MIKNFLEGIGVFTIIACLGVFTTIACLLASITIMVDYFTGDYIRTDRLINTCKNVKKINIGQIVLNCTVEEYKNDK